MTVTVPAFAVIVAVVLELTAVVDTAKVAVVAPAVTVTLAGTAALELFEERVTAVPPDGAAPVKVTVPVALFPPKTELGATEIPANPDTEPAGL